MKSETVKEKLSNLVLKCRQAVRLYSSVGNISKNKKNQYSDIQLLEWKLVNEHLLYELNYIIKLSDKLKFNYEIFNLRDKFNNELNYYTNEYNLSYKKLLVATENSDFITSTILSTNLIKLKSKVEAIEAVCHELSDFIKKSKIKKINFNEKTTVREKAKVISLKQKKA